MSAWKKSCCRWVRGSVGVPDMAVGDGLECEDYAARVQASLHALGIAQQWIEHRKLVLHREPQSLVVAHTGLNGREFLLTPKATVAWLAMRQQASADQVTLALVSAFRSFVRQREIVLDKLGQGLPIDTVLQSVAPPGFSEHHTGRAIDIGTSEDCALEEVFETTQAYAWLSRHAGDFGFQMSYPRDNPFGFVFEPWHWCYHESPG